MADGGEAPRGRTFRLVGELIQEVFPDGTNVESAVSARGSTQGSDDSFSPWLGAPGFAADIFAFCAHVIGHTGAMGYFKLGKPTSNVKSGANSKITIGVDDTLLKAAHEAAREWQTGGKPPEFVQEQWEIILKAWGSRASVTLLRGAKNKQGKLVTRDWWAAIFVLLIASDEASEGLGHFIFDEHGVGNLPDASTARKLFHKDGLHNKIPDIGSTMYRLTNNAWRVDDVGNKHAKMSLPSLGVAANPSVISVQPKGRVTAVGCSVRNLSRNLAAVGPLGSVRCNWQQLSRPAQGEKPSQINLLLIPMPYEIRGSDFRKTGNESFGITQRWLGKSAPKIDDFAESIAALVRKGMEDSDIHGILLPEYALNYKSIEKVVPAIFKASNNKAMFIVTGSSMNCENEPGNIVMTHIWEGVCCREQGTEEAPLDQKFREFSQRKHQRWRLEEGQIGTYGLGSRLDPSKTWWEDHDIGRRELHFFQIAEDTVFTSLICEDLARNDPCHDIIRAIAPNLVFALLMDGPQLATRWPARFAGSLADDPGCTVLTFTSYGLIERSNFQFPEGGKTAVGLLRDSAGQTTEIALPKGKDAVIVSLQSKRAKDKTMDDRETKHASKWKFVSQQPISIGLRDGNWKAPKPRRG